MPLTVFELASLCIHEVLNTALSEQLYMKTIGVCCLLEIINLLVPSNLYWKEFKFHIAGKWIKILRYQQKSSSYFLIYVFR